MTASFNYSYGSTVSHGEETNYNRGCRCTECRAAHAATARRRHGAGYAYHSDLAEFMRSLGWDDYIPARIPAVFVKRWNREHPERPYLAGGSRRLQRESEEGT